MRFRFHPDFSFVWINTLFPRVSVLFAIDGIFPDSLPRSLLPKNPNYPSRRDDLACVSLRSSIVKILRPSFPPLSIFPFSNVPLGGLFPTTLSLHPMPRLGCLISLPFFFLRRNLDCCVALFPMLIPAFVSPLEKS